MGMFNGDPLINQQKIREDALNALGVRDVKAYFEVPPPQPDPEVMAKMADAETKAKDADSRSVTARDSAAKSFSDAAKNLAELGLLPDAATLAAHAVEESQEENLNEPDEGQGDVPGM